MCRASSVVSVFARSSHLRIASRLCPTRCVGVHLLVFVGVPFDDPVKFESKSLCGVELLRDMEPARELVRSKRRVWYANGPVESDLVSFGESLSMSRKRS